MIGLGLTAPLAAQMLASAGVAQAQPKAPAFTPTQRGGGGLLKTLWWQAPTLLNPHFATGTKDQDASRIFYEPLAALRSRRQPRARPRGRGPEREQRARSPGICTWVTWKLKKRRHWHDGKPFTADDVVFNWEFVADPATAAVTERLVPRDRARSRSSTPTPSRSSSTSPSRSGPTPSAATAA